VHALRSGLSKTWSSVCRFSAIASHAQDVQAVTCAEKLPGVHIITTEFAAAEKLLPTKRRKLKLMTCVLGFQMCQSGRRRKTGAYDYVFHSRHRQTHVRTLC
jgi:hypothetical protein